MPHVDPIAKAAYFEARRKYLASAKGRATAAARMRKFRAEHPEYFTAMDRKRRLRRKYQMTQEDFDTMLEQQHGKCALPDCMRTEPSTPSGWHIDHDHVTGKVRGLVCHHCNVAVGSYERNQHRFESFAHYVARGKDS